MAYSMVNKVGILPYSSYSDIQHISRTSFRRLNLVADSLFTWKYIALSVKPTL